MQAYGFPLPVWRASSLYAGSTPFGLYVVVSKACAVLVVSVGLTLCTLTIFGSVQGHCTGAPPWWSVLLTVLSGGMAMGVALGMARAIS